MKLQYPSVRNVLAKGCKEKFSCAEPVMSDTGSRICYKESST